MTIIVRLVAGIAVFLSACGGGGGSSGDNSPAPVTVPITVTTY